MVEIVTGSTRQRAALVVQMDWFLWKINVKTVVPKEPLGWGC